MKRKELAIRFIIASCFIAVFGSLPFFIWFTSSEPMVVGSLIVQHEGKPVIYVSTQCGVHDDGREATIVFATSTGKVIGLYLRANDLPSPPVWWWWNAKSPNMEVFDQGLGYERQSLSCDPGLNEIVVTPKFSKLNSTNFSWSGRYSTTCIDSNQNQLNLNIEFRDCQ